MKNLFKKHQDQMGMALIVFGVILLVVGFFMGWTTSHAVLFVAVISIIAGVFWHVKTQKERSKY